MARFVTDFLDSRWPVRLAWAAALALLAAVSWRWAIEFALPRPTARPVGGLPTPAEAARAVSSRHLFGIADPKAEARPAAALAQVDSGAVRLLGVAAGGDGGGFAIVSVEGRPATPAVAGQEFSPGLKLLAVRPNGIEYERSGLRYQVRMPEKRPAGEVDRARSGGAPLAAPTAPQSKYPSSDALATAVADAQKKYQRPAGAAAQ